MDADVAKIRGLELAKEGRNVEAIPLLEQALAWDSRDANVGFHLANVLTALGRHAEALERVDRALAVSSEESFGHRVRGWILSRMGRHEEALDEALTAVRLSPNLVSGHVMAAASFSELGRHDEARVAAEAAISRNPKSPAAWRARGWADVKLCDRVAARSAFEQAIAIAPDAESLAGLARVSTPEQSLELYRRALTLQPDDTHARANVALQLCRTGRWSEAFESADAIHAMHPEHTLTLEVLVRSAVNSGHDDRAFGLEDEVRARAARLEGTPEAYRMHEALGHIELARGAAQVAEASYERAYALHPWCCLAVGAARAAALRGDVTKAMEWRARAAELDACDSRCCLVTKLTGEIATATGETQSAAASPPDETAASQPSTTADTVAGETLAQTYQRYVAHAAELAPWYPDLVNLGGVYCDVVLLLKFSCDPLEGLGHLAGQRQQRPPGGRSISLDGRTLRLYAGGTRDKPPEPTPVQDALLNALYEHHLDALESISHERWSESPFEEPPAKVYRGAEARAFLASLVGARAHVEYGATKFFTDNANPSIELWIDGSVLTSCRCFEYRHGGKQGPPMLSTQHLRPAVRTFQAAARATSFPPWRLLRTAGSSVASPYRPQTVIWRSAPIVVSLRRGRTYRVTASALDLELTADETRWFAGGTARPPVPRTNLVLEVSES
jgi:tetratricopeptide (TPR) repeat protein